MILTDLLLMIAIAMLGYVIRLQFNNAKQIARNRQEIKDIKKNT